MPLENLGSRLADSFEKEKRRKAIESAYGKDDDEEQKKRREELYKSLKGAFGGS